MAKLDIRIYPDNILRKRASLVEALSEEDRKLASDMIDTMRSANGVGLAAPQVGISKRIIVAGDTERTKSVLVLVNPRIINKKGKSSFCEGCLSVPGITSDVIRPEFIIVEALNLDGKIIRLETEGLLSRVIQHEVDHLDGILFIDRVGFLKRRKLVKKISSAACVEF